jgi:hypothetical protein
MCIVLRNVLRLRRWFPKFVDVLPRPEFGTRNLTAEDLEPGLRGDPQGQLPILVHKGLLTRPAGEG